MEDLHDLLLSIASEEESWELMTIPAPQGPYLPRGRTMHSVALLSLDPHLTVFLPCHLLSPPPTYVLQPLTIIPCPRFCY